jgi:hypothetical protein
MTDILELNITEPQGNNSYQAMKEYHYISLSHNSCCKEYSVDHYNTILQRSMNSFIRQSDGTISLEQSGNGVINTSSVTAFEVPYRPASG